MSDDRAVTSDSIRVPPNEAPRTGAPPPPLRPPHPLERGSSPPSRRPRHPLARPPAGWNRVYCLGCFGGVGADVQDDLAGLPLDLKRPWTSEYGAVVIGRYGDATTGSDLVIILNVVGSARFGDVVAFTLSPGEQAWAPCAVPTAFAPLIAAAKAYTF